MPQITDNDIKGFGWAVLSAGVVGAATAGAGIAVSYLTGANIAGAALDAAAIGAVAGSATQFSKGGYVAALGSLAGAWYTLQEMPYQGWTDALRQTMRGNISPSDVWVMGAAVVFGLAMAQATGHKMRAAESRPDQAPIRGPAKRVPESLDL